jgi:Arc/MetJ-type ribon-helix-helix transcriptional regulator
MPTVEVTLPDRIESEISRLVEQGEFINRDQAVEELLTLGVSSYGTTTDTSEDPGDELFTQTIEDQRDPAMREDAGGDGHSF